MSREWKTSKLLPPEILVSEDDNFVFIFNPFAPDVDVTDISDTKDIKVRNETVVILKQLEFTAYLVGDFRNELDNVLTIEDMQKFLKDNSDSIVKTDTPEKESN